MLSRVSSRATRALRVAPRLTQATRIMNVMRSYAAAAQTSAKEKAMFCFQCEQTEEAKGCSTIGVCGKKPSTSRLQDLVVHANKILSMYAHRARELGAKDADIDHWIIESFFSTMTNVNFDDSRFVADLNALEELIVKAKKMYEDACAKQGKKPEYLPNATFKLASKTDIDALVEQAKPYGVLERQARLGADYVGLQEMITYGLKGMCAYAEHARVLGWEKEEVYAFLHKILNFLTREDATVDELLQGALDVGNMNLTVMALLDASNTGRYGHPEPTKVRMTGVKGKGILVSGHDLGDLEAILKQTEGKGINVYTHGELLPANAYPELKKYPHLKGNYGGPWQNQKIDFSMFPGPIVMTTNCIIEPMRAYKNRIYTRSVVGWPGVNHLKTLDFTPVVEKALEMDGFDEDEPERYTTIGFGRNTVMSVAPQVIEAVKSGNLKHFFLIGGCDGTEGQRSYYRRAAQLAPQDTVILTLGCAKYRLNDIDFGLLPNVGIPRLLDMGQCNDAYSAIQVAIALAKAFDTDVNSLPLSLVISWLEQKAVAVFLTLLSLGIRNIHLGPNLPAFVTPNVLNVLVDKFGVKKTGEESDVAGHMEAMLNRNAKAEL